MKVTKYNDFVIGIDNIKSDDSGIKQFSVRVWESPAGESRVAEYVSIPTSLSRNLRSLEKRISEVRDIIELGEKIADILLPEQARKLLIHSLHGLQPEVGLRLRLKLEPSLANIPWEYVYIQDLTDEDKRDITGFCALNPKISIVRHEPLPIPAQLNLTTKSRRMLVALASPEDEEKLDTAKERKNIENALQSIPGIKSEFVENTTAKLLNDNLISGADIFHFAGHGKFKQSALDNNGGYIVLLDENGKSNNMPAEQLAINLRNRGVQLVVLGACETGRRDEKNVWSGVVTNLMAAGIPATVAMQYKIGDENAIAFSRSFYQALAAGLCLDRAVSLGRIAVFNRCHSVKDEQQRQQYWRDWGVPVLYCRAKEDFALPAITDESPRKALLDELQAGSDVAPVQNQSGGINNSDTWKGSPLIHVNDAVIQYDAEYAVNIRNATGSVTTGNNPRVVNPTFGNVSQSSIGVGGEGVTIGDVIIGTENSSKNDLRSLFAGILEAVKNRPVNPDIGNDEIIQNLERIRDEIRLGVKANLQRIDRWLNFLEIVPDIQRTVIVTLKSPHPEISEPIRQLASKFVRSE